jgi:hypothetical protein
MDKNRFFSGTTVFGQLIDLIKPGLIASVTESFGSDRYCKGFRTYDHLVSMLFACFAHCTSLREIEGAFASMHGKTKNSGIGFLPRRSTLSDANKRRSSQLFEQIYKVLFNHYRDFISDSRLRSSQGRPIYLLDSTTISLFQAILENAGRKPKSGKAKGGVKVHTLLKLEEQVPMMVWMSKASAHDAPYLSKFDYEAGSIYLFDRGYVDYQAYDRITKSEAFFVSRLKENANYEVLEENDASGKDVKSDLRVRFNRAVKGKVFTNQEYRIIEVEDEKTQKSIKLLTNIKDLKADQVGDLYRKRWQIEMLFKQIKQNYPLKYFLGDTPNAIEIQIWVALIANLLITVMKTAITRSIAHSNITTFIRINLLAYIKLVDMLNHQQIKNKTKARPSQLSLFRSG